MKNIVVLTGAGISAESGLKTFRDSDGLWEGHAIEDVATPGAWRRNPKLVLDFYNMRRRDVAAAIPNEAHVAVADLERDHEVTVITQNVDDLHERAGSSKVMHLHGEIFKMRSDRDQTVTFPVYEDMVLGAQASDGGFLRPAIVWFEEPVPMIELAASIVAEADIFILVGSSLQVYPAAGLLHYVPRHAPIYIVDKKIPEVAPRPRLHLFEKPATAGMLDVLSAIRLG